MQSMFLSFNWGADAAPADEASADTASALIPFFTLVPVRVMLSA